MNSDKPILKELNQRVSMRFFSNREIELEKLEALWAAGQWAPSSSNKQEWHYYAVTGAVRKKFADILVPGNHWALQAPLLLGVTRDTTIENKTESREYGAYDVALSVMCLVIEAEHQGLRAHQMAGFKDEPFRRLLNIPAHEEPVVVVAVGYAGDLAAADPTVREKESRPRARKSIPEIVTIIKT